MTKTEVQTPSQDTIRLRSYKIWQTEGCPNGHELDHWLRAEMELEAETCAKPTRRKTMRKTIKKAVKKL
jgi:hypothetical protein